MQDDNDGQQPSSGTVPVASNAPNATRILASTANGFHKLVSESPDGSSQSGKGPERPRPATYLGHDREEVTRILIQALTDMGFNGAAELVSVESGFELEGCVVAAFRKAVLEGAWVRAEELLATAGHPQDRRQAGGSLLLAPGADRNDMRFWLRQQKFLELLEQGETSRALLVLRGELTPLCQEHQKLHFLSSLLMCQSSEDLKARAEWDGAHGRSRYILLSELSRCISPSVMLPEHRLAVLLQQVKDTQIGTCLYHTRAEPPSLYSDHACDRSFFPSEAILELDQHSDEVWQVKFSHGGSRMASCGKEGQVIIWSVPSFDILHRLNSHGGGVGNIAWSPDDTMIISCGCDHYAKIWNAETGALIRSLGRFDEPVSSCVWAADCRSFVTGSFDKHHSLCHWNLDGDKLFTLTHSHRTEDLAISPDGRWLVAMDDRSHVHVYNFITRELEYEMELKAQPTSVSVSLDSQLLLINQLDGEAQLIEIATRNLVQKYIGHTGGKYVIRSAFGGANESFVVSGSEDGHICVWHKTTGIQVEKLAGHQPRCNSVSWSPADPCMIASCGDDGKIKIWSNKERARSISSRSQQEEAGSRSVEE